MNKAYSRINWQNAPSEATALNETNLNKMDSAIDTIDDRVVAHDTQIANAEYAITNMQSSISSLESGKVDKVAGKGLSTNDYDNTAKGIVDGVTSALANKVDKVTGKGLCRIQDFNSTWGNVNTGTFIGTIYYTNQNGVMTARDIYNGMVAITNAQIDALE